jgi:hypothetical protein
MYCLSLGFHPHVRIASQDLTGDVPRNIHDGLVTGPAFGEFGHQGVARVVPAAFDARFRLNVLPRCLQSGHRARRVQVLGLAERKQEPGRLSHSEPPRVPASVVQERSEQHRIQRNRPALASFRLTARMTIPTLLRPRECAVEVLLLNFRQIDERLRLLPQRSDKWSIEGRATHPADHAGGHYSRYCGVLIAPPLDDSSSAATRDGLVCTLLGLAMSGPDTWVTERS